MSRLRYPTWALWRPRPVGERPRRRIRAAGYSQNCPRLASACLSGLKGHLVIGPRLGPVLQVQNEQVPLPTNGLELDFAPTRRIRTLNLLHIKRQTGAQALEHAENPIGPVLPQSHSQQLPKHAVRARIESSPSWLRRCQRQPGPRFGGA